MRSYKNLDTCNSYSKLRNLATKNSPFDYRSELTAERVSSSEVSMAGGLSWNWAALPVDAELLAVLQELAEEQELIQKYTALLNGEEMNTGEKRMVLHQLARGQCAGPVVHHGRNLADFYTEELRRIRDFADKIRRGDISAADGRPFSCVVQIGIGGSDLGPRALYLALEHYARAEGLRTLQARFISNVDPDDAASVLNSLDLEHSLFILVSKSGTTQETLANEIFVRKALENKGLKPEKQMLAVTSETSPLANSDSYLDSFYIDDFIGGRYSATSAVGALVLSLAFGPDTVAELLDGAHQADLTAMEPSLQKNAALFDACVGVYLRSVLGYPATAVLPYSQALHRFPAHLQQLDMESNGKRVNRFGESINYSTGPLVFGESGTNGQHSFYQLLHQGTDGIPLQFIGFKNSQLGVDISVEGSSSQQKLNANLAAQIVAFAKGKDDANANKQFPGQRPSSLIVGERLSPAALGALLAHYENKVMFQGLLWNINSFDQEGVQLGKILTKQVLGGDMQDAALREYALLLGVL